MHFLFLARSRALPYQRRRISALAGPPAARNHA
jgi:hypothetical protein